MNYFQKKTLKFRSRRFTKPGAAFLGLIVLLYMFSITYQTGLMFIVMGLILGCYAVNYYFAKRSVDSIQLDADKYFRGVEGENLRGIFSIKNLSNVNSCGMFECIVNNEVMFKVQEIEPRNISYFKPDLVISKRGAYKVLYAEVKSSYPFGLINYSKQVDLHTEFLVYPKVYHCVIPLAAGFEPAVGGKFKGAFNSSSGSDFAGIRDYIYGDCLRNIHWRSSSKGQGIKVKEFREEMSGHTSFILDCTVRNNKSSIDVFDSACRAAGSLIFEALDAGHQSEFISTYDNELIHIPPFADGDSILEYLARVSLNKSQTTVDIFENIVSKLSPKSAVHMILLDSDKQLVDMLYKSFSKFKTFTIYFPISSEKTLKTDKYYDQFNIYFYDEDNIIYRGDM
ncbi:MAG TPA: DUF58 domain-containing protein [Victivallales bacterium]|nr:DUF58 domain-containing protein [Victivallales bacterium]